jgi:predicted RNase H-like HicB family nuclease
VFNPKFIGLYGSEPVFSLDIMERFTICCIGRGADILGWTERNKKGGSMKLTALIEREGDGYVSLCPELDIASQGDTIESARDNLHEALELFFRDRFAGRNQTTPP